MLTHYSNGLGRTACRLSSNPIEVSSNWGKVNCKACKESIVNKLYIFHGENQKMTICPTCRTELEQGSPSAIGVALKRHIEANGGWDQGFSEDQKYRFDVYTADIVKVKDSWGDPNSDRYEDYSYIHQGDTFEAFVVFRVGDTFFRKSGRGDSYGEVSWDGDFEPVTMKIRTVEVYEFGAN